MRTLPGSLFRGDKDAYRERKLVESWKTGWLQTNLGSGGRGKDIFSAPLTKRVEQHVNGTWAKTHFLSFSASRTVAEWFALGETKKTLVPLQKADEPWDSSILTLDCSRLSIARELSVGVVFCTYPHQNYVPPADQQGIPLGRMMQDGHRAGKLVPVLLIDVLTTLESLGSNDPQIAEACAKAKWDQEWLVLPCETFVDERRLSAELTALLDDSCIAKREKFRFG